MISPFEKFDGWFWLIKSQVRRRATYYHLSDSMLVRTAFSGIKGAWFIQMDVVPASGHGSGPSSVDELVKDDSNLELNAHIPTLPCVSDALLIPCVSGKNQPPRTESPSCGQLPVDTQLGDASGREAGSVESLRSPGKQPDVDHGVCKPLPQSGVSGSLDDQLREDDAEDKEPANPGDGINEAAADTVASSKEQPQGKNIEPEDSSLLKQSSGKKRHKKHKGNDDGPSRKGQSEDNLEATLAENGPAAGISREQNVGQLGILGELCSRLLSDDSLLPQDLLHKKKKKKKRRRSEADDYHNEEDTAVGCNASDSHGKSAHRVESTELESNKMGFSLGKEATEGDPNDKMLTITDIHVQSAEESIKKKNNDSHMDLDSEVAPPKERKRSTGKGKKIKSKVQLSGYEFVESEIVQLSGKKVAADEPNHPVPRPDVGTTHDEAYGIGNAAGSVHNAIPDASKTSKHKKKKSDKLASSKVESDRKETFSSAVALPRETTVISGSVTEIESAVPPKSEKTLTRSKKKSVNAEASAIDPSIADPVSLLEQPFENKYAEAAKDRPSAEDEFTSKSMQLELITEHGYIKEKSHKRKLHENDSVVKNQKRSHKKKSSNVPQAVQKNDEGREKSVTGDNNASGYHDQNTSAGSNLKKQVLKAKLEKSAEHQEASDDIGQKHARGNVVNSGKEMAAYPAESSDTTEEDSVYDNKLYRIAVRKVRKSRSKKDLKRSDQEEICLNASDDTFGHFTSASSGDEVEAHGQKDTNKNVPSNSANIYPEEDINPTLVVRGPKVQKKTGHSGNIYPVVIFLFMSHDTRSCVLFLNDGVPILVQKSYQTTLQLLTKARGLSIFLRCQVK